jgi:hypothetical protein
LTITPKPPLVRTVNDGVLNGTTTVTSATAAFLGGAAPAGDVGASITGTGIPAGASIASVTNATTVVISAAATASGTGRTLTITRGDLPYAPYVSLPAAGSATAITASDSDGAKGVYGPAVIHGGLWPCNETGDRNCPASGPASGPQGASTQGTPAGGTVTSSADIGLFASPVSVACYTGYGPNCYSTGGFGPFPVQGDSVHVECTATQSAVTGSTTLSNATIAHATTPGGDPLPSSSENIPNNPPVNFTRSGVITNVGDVFAIVFNEQIVNSDGSLTVNGMHMYLFGPTAVGEMVRGQATCGTDGFKLSATDTTGPTCGVPIVEPNGPSDPTPKNPHTELVGVYDTGGLKSITNVQAPNGTVQPGVHPGGPDHDISTTGDNPFPYLVFKVGQTTPLPVTAIRSAAAENATPPLPLIWSFDATDMANNVTHCQGVLPHTPPADFDGNRRTDASLYRPSTSQWLVENQPSTFLGASTDTPVPCNFNGGSTAVPAVFRPSVGGWYIQGKDPIFFGTSSDIPVPGDYNGDGTCDIAVFRPSVGGWYIDGQAPLFYGANGDIPVPGDYNGDGTTDAAVFRPSVGGWYINGQPTVYFGAGADIPVPGDYDADGKTDTAVFRPSVGGWYVPGRATVFFGVSGDVPVPGDYDANGTTDPAVYRNGTWFVQGGATTSFGSSGDIPLPLPASIRRAFFP